MSDTVKLSSRLPGDLETNGIDAQATILVDDPETIRIAVLWYDVTKVTTDTDSGKHVPTIRVRRIEPIGDVDQVPDDLRKLVDDAVETRTGRVPLPFDSVEGGFEVVDE